MATRALHWIKKGEVGVPALSTSAQKRRKEQHTPPGSRTPISFIP